MPPPAAIADLAITNTAADGPSCHNGTAVFASSTAVLVAHRLAEQRHHAILRAQPRGWPGRGLPSIRTIFSSFT
jgi:hypothetical protein